MYVKLFKNWTDCCKNKHVWNQTCQQPSVETCYINLSLHEQQKRKLGRATDTIVANPSFALKAKGKLLIPLSTIEAPFKINNTTQKSPQAFRLWQSGVRTGKGWNIFCGTLHDPVNGLGNKVPSTFTRTSAPQSEVLVGKRWGVRTVFNM